MEIAIIINPSTIITDIQMPLLNGIEKEKNGNNEFNFLFSFKHVKAN